MRKRVGIARAIALRPRYILYDEPTTGLDPVTSAVIDQLMVRTNRELGVTGVVVTHDLRSAFTVGDRLAMLYQGTIRQVGPWRRCGRATIPWCASSWKAGPGRTGEDPTHDLGGGVMRQRNEFLVGLSVLGAIAVVVAAALWLSESSLGRRNGSTPRDSAPSAASGSARR